MNHIKIALFRFLRYGLCPLLTVLWLCFIFGNSLQSGVESSEQSGKVHQIVNEVAQSVGIEEPISEKAVRKGAHFLEFAILSSLICTDLFCFGLVKLKAKPTALLTSLCAVPLCAILAMIDEYIQTFSAGRSCQWEDVLLDTSGAALAAVCFLGVCFALRALIGRKKAVQTRQEKDGAAV